MKTSTNFCRGTTYSLEDGDMLASLPSEFRDAVSPEIVAAFSSPITFFRDIAQKTKCTSFSKFLDHCTHDNSWCLDVSETYLPVRSFSADFKFMTSFGRSYFLRPGRSLSGSSELNEIHQYLTRVNWGGIGCAGEIFSGVNQPTLEQYGFGSENSAFPTNSTIVFGNSPCGDAMIYNEDGLAGYITHETYGSYQFGTLSSMIDWIFDSLASDRLPEFEWDRLHSGG